MLWLVSRLIVFVVKKFLFSWTTFLIYTILLCQYGFSRRVFLSARKLFFRNKGIVLFV